MADNAVDGSVGKAETAKEDGSTRSTSSIASTPEADVEPCPQEQHPTQKRKGGRKPVSSRFYHTLPLGSPRIDTHVANKKNKDICHLGGT